MIKNFLNPEGHQNPISGSKVTAILQRGRFCLLVELHREGSAFAACAAGLFFNHVKGPAIKKCMPLVVIIEAHDALRKFWIL